MTQITPPRPVVHLCETLRRAGFEAWLVGGAVRDAFLGRDPHDWDIATNARPEQVQKVFPKTFPTGIEHGTITVRHDHESYEVTTFRGDANYSDGRRPDDVVFKDRIEDDLARRDFTINAIAYDPLEDHVCDPFEGLDDLRMCILRAVGNPLERFSEDGLRCLRAARFCAALNFSLERHTEEAIRPSLQSYEKVSMERIRDEWIKTMGAGIPSIGFDLMMNHGLFSRVPEFLDLVGCKQNRYHEYDVWGHTMAVVDALPASDPMLRLTGLFHDISKPETRCFDEEKQDYTFHDHEVVGAEKTTNIFSRMRFSTRERERVSHLVRHHLVMYDSSWGDAAVRRWVRKVRPEHVEAQLELARADIVGKGDAKTHMDRAAIDELASRIEALEKAVATPASTNALVINGNDLMAHLNIEPGPRIGRILKALLDRVTDDPSLNTKESLLEMASKV